jgi:hypothetical protein
LEKMVWSLQLDMTGRSPEDCSTLIYSMATSGLTIA